MNIIKICLWIKMNVNTTEELDKVIHAVNVTATRIKEIETAKKKATLAVGDTVTFKGRRNATLEGVITRMKIKNAIVKVREPNGDRLWDCPFSMLEVV